MTEYTQKQKEYIDYEATMKTIERALNRFKELVNSLECECDSYNGFTCVNEALDALNKLPHNPSLKADKLPCDWCKIIDKDHQNYCSWCGRKLNPLAP